MKKLFLYLVVFMCLFTTGCGNNKTREAATLDEFESVASNDGFTVSDNEIKYDSANYIEDSKVAVYDDIQIEMIKYTDSEYASKVQEQQIENFNLLKSTGAFVIKEKGSNYYEYALVSNGRYMVSTRVDDTLIFSKTMLENKETVETMIDALGY